MKQIILNFLFGFGIGIAFTILTFLAVYIINKVDIQFKNIRQLRHTQVQANTLIIIEWAKSCHTKEELKSIRREAENKFTLQDRRRKENRLALNIMRDFLTKRERELSGKSYSFDFHQAQGDMILKQIK